MLFCRSHQLCLRRLGIGLSHTSVLDAVRLCITMESRWQPAGVASQVTVCAMSGSKPVCAEESTAAPQDVLRQVSKSDTRVCVDMADLSRLYSVMEEAEGE